MALSLAVTSAVKAQTGTRADSVAMMRARFKAMLRAHAETALANVRPRMTEALRVAKTSKKPVLVYVVDSGSWSSRVFDDFLHSAKFGQLMSDNFVFLRLTGRETEPIRINPRPDSTAADSTMRVLAGLSVNILDSTGRVTGLLPPPLEGFAIERLSSLWPASQCLKRLAPHITEADRQRIVEYLMQWSEGW